MASLAATASRRVAVADVRKAAINVAAELARLGDLTIFELRREWRHFHRMPPPMRLSRELLMRGITYKVQERALGGLSKSVLRKLESFNAGPGAGDARKPTPPISVKPGTRLVREWRGTTHSVRSSKIVKSPRRASSAAILIAGFRMSAAAPRLDAVAARLVPRL